MLGILRLFNFHVTSSLHRRRILTSVSNVCEEALMSLFRAPRTQRITGRAFRISFHLVWQIDIGMACTQILVPRWGPEQRFRRCFAEGLDQQLVSSAVQAMLPEVYVKNTKSIFLVEKKIVIVWFSYFNASNAVKKINIPRYRNSHKKDRKWNGGGARERERKKKPAFSLAPPLSFPESTSHQLSHGCISYFTYHKRKNTPKKLVPMQAIALPGAVYRWLLI